MGPSGVGRPRGDTPRGVRLDCTYAMGVLAAREGGGPYNGDCSIPLVMVARECWLLEIERERTVQRRLFDSDLFF
jgi:hypothetical protein